MKTITYFLLVILILCSYGFCQAQDSPEDSIPSTFARDGNIIVKLDEGQERQLTFNQSDEKPIPIPSKDKIIFVRNERVVQGQKEYFRKKIMTVGINDFIEEEVSSQKPYIDGKNNTTEIRRVDYPAVSSDGNYLYFLTNHTSTTSQVIKLEIASGKWKLLFSAEFFEMLNSGPFKDHFLIGRQETGAAGKGIYYYLVDEIGKKVKEFNSKENMEQFKKSVR